MRRLLPVLLAAAALLPTPAHASGATYAGRCHLTVMPDQPMLFGNAREAMLHAAVAVYATDPAAGPVPATVTCDLRVDGVTYSEVRGRGTTAVLVAGRAALPYWEPHQPASVCTTVDFDDATPTVEECVPLTTTEVPPPEVYEPVYDAVDDVFVQHVDPTVCSAFAALAPGVPGVDVTAGGDVYVAGEWVWDCAPYGDYAPPAGDRSTWAGRCRWRSMEQVSYHGAYYGYLEAVAVLYSPEAAANPVSGTVRCSIRVNGTDVTAGTGTGTGVVVVLAEAPFAATEFDVVELCTRVEFADGTPTAERCERSQWLLAPLEARLQELFTDTADPLFVQYIDPPLCAALVALRPYVPGIDEQGDVYVGDQPYWDCPPYDLWG